MSRLFVFFDKQQHIFERKKIVVGDILNSASKFS